MARARIDVCTGLNQGRSTFCLECIHKRLYNNTLNLSQKLIVEAYFVIQGVVGAEAGEGFTRFERGLVEAMLAGSAPDFFG